MKQKKIRRGRTPDGQPNPVDVHVGRRMKNRRALLGITQEKMAEELGLTFQQVQKYERGLNRIGASRLWDISKILDVPVGYFYDEMDKETEKRSPRMITKSGSAGSLQEDVVSMDFDPLSKKETIDLIRDYYNITSPKVAKMVRNLLKSLSTEGADEDK